ncbi:CusA/CzcA family heavy metal efflux RND transporter [Cellulophaga sp. BC115SP]|uniref:CusA/CzcA family heavy metal efflux RND transporter n=1 Tax=Cellulophaga sp. BC115SP TaxID=2683263 RepID=UPI001412375C|nr:CusA/CzcA family heavy metal efflux RND transporter [Cellulophaga sp. BC115SP]NBB28670.1 CusA/CzcA family heavy metal efflux RND transporter [Cellulophaga sp. BC115SP]
MIDSLIRFSINQKLIIGLFVLSLIAWGGISLTQLTVDALPDITSNQVQVITQSPALPATEVEKFITIPLEISLRTVPNTKEIRSFSRMGLSIITVVFEDDVPIEKARQQVTEKLKEAEPNLIAGAGRPELAPITTGLGEFYQYTLAVDPKFKNNYSLTELRTIQDWIVKRQLLGIKGVVEVSSFGGNLKQYEVAINPERLSAANITLNELFTALQDNNSNSGGSYIEKGTDAYFIRSEGMVKNVEDIGNIVVANRGGIPVLVKDVATVQFGHAVRYGAMTRNGEGEAVGAVVLLLKGASAQVVTQDVKARIKEIQKSLPEGITIQPFLDRSKLIDKAIGTVEKNLVEGGLIVIFVLVLLLGNLRAGLVVASVIPLCLLFSFSMMNLFGVSANLMSLGAIDFGLIVDGAVIIVEAIIHHLHERAQKSGTHTLTLTQQEMNDEVYHSAVTIRKSAAFGEIIILIVYFPILALTGIEGKMFKPMAQTVGFAIIGALILSLTYVPMMSSLLLSKKVNLKETISDKIINFLYKFYAPIIRWVLHNKAVVVGGAVAMFAGSLLLFNSLGGEFIPELNEGDFAVETLLHSNASLSQSIKMNNQAQQIILREFPDEVSQVVSRIGASEIPTDPMGINSCDLIIELKDMKHWKKAETMEELSAKMDDALSELPGVNFEFTQPIQMRFNELIAGTKSDVAIKIFGEDLDILYQKAQESAKHIAKIEGVGDLKVQQIEGVPQMVVDYNREKIAQYGLKIKELNALVKTAFAGEEAGVVYEGEKRFGLVVRLDSAYRKDLQNISDLYVDLPNGGKIPLSQVANISYQDAPTEIARDNARRRITIGINVRNRDVESLVHEIQQVLDKKVELPAGYNFVYGGAFENLNAAKSRLAIAVPVALFLIFALLFFTFNSLKEALIIFAAIPLSAIGGVMALWLRGMPFSVSAGIGFIALFGVAVLNGIVLIAYFNSLEKQGITDIYERIIEGTKTRFRPVVMTAAVASLGFLPMALSHSPGAEVQRPLATVVIGGLISATLLTLVVLPAIYSLAASRIKVKPSVVIIIVLLGFGVGNTTNAQNSPVLTLDHCIEKAIQQNQSLQVGKLEISGNRALEKTAKDLPKTSFDTQFGRTQTYTNNDVTFSLGQSFAFPSLYKAQENLLKSHTASSEKRLNMTKNQVVAEVKSLYYQILLNTQLLKVVQQQDSLYQSAFKAASLRYQTGETNLLEKVSTETRLHEIQNRIQSILSDEKSLYQSLSFLLNITADFVIDTQTNMQKPLQLQITELSNNPYLELLRQQIEVSQLQTKLEKERLKPDFKVGITNQSIERNYNQNFVQAGLNFPLFAKAQKARINAAGINEQIAKESLSLAEQQTAKQLQSLKIQLEKLRKSVQYYQSSAIPQANLMISTAHKSYQAGEIEYVEFVQSITQAWQIKEMYLSEVHNLNQVIINIETLVGHE